MKRLMMVLFVGLAACRNSTETSVMVYAAASTKEAVEAVLKDAPVPTQINVAASSVLARQIEAGAPAGLFLSADTRWMDYLEQRNLLQPKTRAPLLSGRLVLIAHKNALADPRSWQARLRAAEHIAMADPDHVPAGRYAKSALAHAGLLTDIEPKIVRAANVRGALALLVREEVPLAIVYATDAKLSAHVQVVQTLTLPESVEVQYPLAGIAGYYSTETRAVREHLHSKAALDIFRSFGFSVAQP